MRPDEDYTAHYHNGTNWAEVLNPDQVSSDTTLMPDESFIIVRRHESETEISISGLANINASAWQMPPFGKRISYATHSLPRSCYRIYLIPD